MTDRGRHARRLAALGLVPLTVGGFGSAVAWSASHQPATPATTPSAPPATATTDPQLTQALAEIADARNRIAALQATLDQQAAQAAAAQSQPASAAKAPAARAPAAKAPAAPAPAAAPAPPPPVHTTTRASG